MSFSLCIGIVRTSNSGKSFTKPQPKPKTSPVLKTVHTELIRRATDFTSWRVEKGHGISELLIQQSDIRRVNDAKGGHLLRFSSDKESVVIPKGNTIWLHDSQTGIEKLLDDHSKLVANPYRQYQKLLLPKRSPGQNQRNLLAFDEAWIDERQNVQLKTGGVLKTTVQVGKATDRLRLLGSEENYELILAKDLVEPSLQIGKSPY